ncbi:MAG: 5'/3'-nucleotidase SurE [Corallococcus sp.]|nr:5'/3'-nucleotidase SurE [Corallococcus sp.]MCM1359617.1 5'/3'-nucleotidase SurE [Corallococcus sp.]MCM1395209.1 5'/3'-nucleotidase SurE [Corallococcus sp.]
MKILITNDDGIDSVGLEILTKWATKLGDVTVVAPKTQQSGKSHAITIHSPFEVQRVYLGLGEVAAYSVGSTPVDCVRFGTLGLRSQYDLILSGINRGYNIGEDVLYSGTVGAIFEAALRHTRGIAFSTVYTGFEYAEAALESIWEYFKTHELFERHLIYNVNVPPEPKGILETRQGGPYFNDEFVDLNDGTWQQNGYCVHDNRHDLTLDTDATVDGYITITPLTTDRSAH